MDDGVNQGDPEAKTDCAASKSVRVKEEKPANDCQTSETPYRPQCKSFEGRWAWFCGLRVTEVTAHWVCEALNKGNPRRRMFSGAGKEYLGTYLPRSAI